MVQRSLIKLIAAVRRLNRWVPENGLAGVARVHESKPFAQARELVELKIRVALCIVNDLVVDFGFPSTEGL
jgi:hypothetical protein